MTHPRLLGLGTALPEHRMSQPQAAAMAVELSGIDPRQQRVLEKLYRKAGVEQRYTSLPHTVPYQWLQEHEQSGNSTPFLGPTTNERMRYYEELALPLAAQAVRQAMERARLQGDEITHLVTVSCTGFYAPGLDIQLMRAFSLPPTTQRVQVGFMGCHGVLNGLRVCQGLAAVDPQARILLCAVELCCLHYRVQWDPDKFLGNLLFSDGAAALVLGNSAENTFDSPAESLQLTATGSCLIPDSVHAMSWRIGDHGFEMTLDASVPDLVRDHLRPWLSQWLHEQGLSISEIGFWAVHPGGPRILSAVEQSLELAEGSLEVSREVLSTRGNMSSPTVLFILEEYAKRGVSGPGVMLGFGPGLVAEAALLR